MWSAALVILHFLYPILAEMTAPGIERTVTDGVRSLGYNVVYGDEDLTVINQVVKDEEKWNTVTKSADINLAIPPLPAEDVKCLMSVDRYCTNSMGKMKNVLIEALRDDCSKCSSEEKEGAGKVVASMMAHDPVAWKLFLTRSALQILPEKEVPKEERNRYKIIGEPEYIENSRNRFTTPGVKVRVKRYATEIIY